MNFCWMMRKCESKGLGFARFPREAVEGLLERARRALARPLANLVPPPPSLLQRCSGLLRGIWRGTSSALRGLF